VRLTLALIRCGHIAFRGGASSDSVAVAVFRRRPVGRCVGGPSPCRAIVAFVWVSPLRSRPFARPGGRGIDRAVSTASFGRARPGAPLSDAFSAPRMRTTLGVYEPSSCLHRIASTSDVLVVTLRHARAGLFAVRCASRVRSSRIVTAVDLGAVGPSLRAARKSNAGDGPKTPSVVSRTSEPKPACRLMRQRLNESAYTAHRFAFSRPVLRVRRSFELPSG